ncbi:MAG: hypothetical protein J6S10_02240 [Clostridia bacterium]|nr:hypothetical protein [Clostridia bacterium]
MKTGTFNFRRLCSLALVFIMLATCVLTACDRKDDEPETPAVTTTTTPPVNSETPEEYDTITIAEALALCGDPGNITTERYYIRATVKTVKNAQYGQMVIEDETGEISVYGTYSADGALTYAQLEYQPVKGDEVLLHCILQNYNGTKEVKNARLIEYVNNQGNIDISDYTAASISEARAAEAGENLKVSGVVARITYANGMKPNGFILVDNSASIYVFDMDAAQRVSIGNKVEIAGTKDFWILDTEQESAEKFGYKGCNQLTNVTLVSNDNGNTAFDTSWIEETTVKDLLATPVSEDITTTVYKVTALVKKVPGNGFVNYYFFDLDGETGAYTYTQCNGGDFAWLDQFDGKICTVYLTALNAKSQATSCFFRLLPIAVYDEGFQFNLADTAKHVVKYYGVDQFLANYTGNPQTELITTVSSELLGFEGATLTYTSSNENVIYFTTEEGKTIFNCGVAGSATVTITAQYGQTTYSETIEVTVSTNSDIDYITVAEAITTPIDTDVVVKGIVGPSVVNKNGFYLFGEDGSVIAVLVNSTDELVGLEIGHEIIISGMRERYIKDDSYTTHGQSSIVKATILANYYGNHEYSTAKFVTDSTVEAFYALDKTVDYSTTVFVLDVRVERTSSGYSSNYNLYSTTSSTYISLYCSGAGQYDDLLQQFNGQTVTIEIAACNWNDKNYWRGCILAVRTPEGKIYNQLNFDAN